MLKLTPDEIRQAIKDSGLVEQDEEITPDNTALVLIAIADHAAEHAAREIYQFLRDWQRLLPSQWDKKYPNILDSTIEISLASWLRSQGVDA
jgi:hypothetical protein